MKRWIISWAAGISLLASSGLYGQAHLSHVPVDPEILAEIQSGENKGFDFDRREAMVPMRDGVHLFTVILIPRMQEPMPIMLTRTPYGASRRTPSEAGPRLESALPGGEDIFAGAHYIRVFQDIRGRHRSEGNYVMNLPLSGSLNPAGVDHSTDAYDTVEWLLNNVPQNNGRVGMIGSSYDGFLVLMGLVRPHPALKAAVAINPMVDTWMGDDWFHRGAFHQMMMDFLHVHETSRDSSRASQDSVPDGYDLYRIALQAGSAAELARSMKLDPAGFWRKLLQHPAYDGFWQSQALDRILAGGNLGVPTMYVHSLWDQEDIYGAVAVYRATELQDRNNDRNYLVIGPWSHGRANQNGSFLGPLKFNGDTARYFRYTILLPFLNEYLKAGSPKANIPPVFAYETGTNTWRRYASWPLSCESGCGRQMRPIYLKPGLRLGFDPPASDETPYAEYVSDPAQPVPHGKRPVLLPYHRGSSWEDWMVSDQRWLADRPDVLSYQSEILTEPVVLSGQPMVNLFASTTGTDSDFILKLIDVYPDQYPSQPELGGYQLMISADILRGRYRHDYAHPSPIPAGKVERYRWALPAVSHVFLPGHRIMVQIQSSWFPLYDRNPQSYVENIFHARPEDYRKATQRIYQTGMQASSIELPIAEE